MAGFRFNSLPRARENTLPQGLACGRLISRSFTAPELTQPWVGWGWLKMIAMDRRDVLARREFQVIRAMNSLRRPEEISRAIALWVRVKKQRLAALQRDEGAVSRFPSP